MATRQQREKLREEVGDLLASAVNMNADEFARSDLGDDLNFAELVPDLELMITPLQTLAGRRLEMLSSQQLERIKKAALLVSERTTEIRDFNVATLQGAPMEARNQIVQRVQEAPDQVLELLSLPLALTSTDTADIGSVVAETRELKSEVADVLGEARKEVKQYEQEASKALTAIKNIAGEAGVAEHAGHFETSQGIHASAASKWLRATIGSAGVTLVVAIVFLIVAAVWTPASTAQSIQYGLAKLILLSVLSFATIWSARNYRASRHNELVNQHRQDALGTFRAFVEASDDPQVRDAILLQASQAIFVGRTTGFDSTEPAQSTPVPVFETIGRFSDGAEG